MTRPKDKDAPGRRRLVRYPELEPVYGIPWSRMHVDRLEKAGKFPKRVHLGPNTVAWFDDELLALVEQRAAERGASAA
jgi:prophage regulatory protein